MMWSLILPKDRPVICLGGRLCYTVSVKVGPPKGLDLSRTLLCVASAIFEAPGAGTLWGFFFVDFTPQFSTILMNVQLLCTL
jgi:hypothetical protein